MKKLLPLLVSTFILVAGCAAGDSFTPSPELQAAADCAGLSLEDFATIYNNVLELLDQIGDGVIPGNMTYDIGSGAYTMDLAIGSVAGVVTAGPSTTLSDGLGVGESATTTWALNGGLAGTSTATGEGSFTVARATATRHTVSGLGGFLDGTCQFDYPTLNFTVESAVGLVGTINFTATTPDGVLDGTITFSATPTARVDASFDGVDYVFQIDLVTFEPIF